MRTKIYNAPEWLRLVVESNTGLIEDENAVLDALLAYADQERDSELLEILYGEREYSVGIDEYGDIIVVEKE